VRSVHPTGRGGFGARRWFGALEAVEFIRRRSFVAAEVPVRRIDIRSPWAGLAALTMLELPDRPGGTPSGYRGQTPENQALTRGMMAQAMHLSGACHSGRLGEATTETAGALAMAAVRWLETGGPATIGETDVRACLGGLVEWLVWNQWSLPIEPGEYVLNPEICDGLDDDCDGKADEGVPGCEAALRGEPGYAAGAACPDAPSIGLWSSGPASFEHWPIDLEASVFAIGALVAADRLEPTRVPAAAFERILRTLPYHGAGGPTTDEMGFDPDALIAGGSVHGAGIVAWAYQMMGVDCAAPAVQAKLRFIQRSYRVRPATALPDVHDWLAMWSTWAPIA